jgi:hypothetical protein
MAILPDRSTTNFTPAVLAVAHPSWCTVAACRPTPDWDHAGTGFVAHHLTLLDSDGLLVEVVAGETVSPQGEVLEQDPAVVQIAAGWEELTPERATRLADALLRAAAIAGGAR